MFSCRRAVCMVRRMSLATSASVRTFRRRKLFRALSTTLLERRVMLPPAFAQVYDLCFHLGIYLIIYHTKAIPKCWKYMKKGRLLRLESGMSPNHILDLHGNPLHNCLIKRVLEKTQPNFAVIGIFPHASYQRSGLIPPAHEKLNSSISRSGSARAIGGALEGRPAEYPARRASAWRRHSATTLPREVQIGCSSHLDLGQRHFGSLCFPAIL